MMSHPSCTSSWKIASIIIWKVAGELVSLNVTILWLRRLTVGLIDCHVIRKAHAMGSTPDEGHCTVLRVQPLLRCVNIWTVYLSPSSLTDCLLVCLCLLMNCLLVLTKSMTDLLGCI